MERREFLIKSGTLLTTATFLSSFGRANSLLANAPESVNEENKRRRPDSNDFHQPVIKAIALGINAPSPHNTQSWKFKVLNDTEMLLYVDENFLLPATDPLSRQIHMGAGCFIETLVLGAERLGYKSTVVIFPEGYSSESDFGKKSVAKIKLGKSGFEANLLSSVIEDRQTNRRIYKGEMITTREFEELAFTTGESYSKLVFKNEGMEPFFDLFYKGFEIESKTHRTNEETRNLFRFSEEERARKRDGISIPQMGYKGLMKSLAENSLDKGNKAKWHSEKSINLSLKNVKKGIESSKGLVFWYTETNSFTDWVEAGRDYVRFNLALTQKSLYAHPYNQAIQEYVEMKDVREKLNELLGISDPKKVQMIVRIGRSSIPYYSYRRHMEDYLRK